MLRRIGGAAALGYVAGVGIENMDVLQAPFIGDPIRDIRSFYDDQALGVVTNTAGSLALLFYCVFAAGLISVVFARLDGLALVAVLGAVGGPAVAAFGQAASAILVVEAGGGLGDDLTRALFDLHLVAQMVAAPFVALFLGGIGLGALRGRAMPAWLAWFACALAVPIALSPIAALTGNHALQVAVTLAFSADTLWIFLVGVWMALAEGVSAATFVRRAAFLVLVIAAGLVGIALLAVPASTGSFFSWGLSPAPLAAFAGGVYVASAIVYAVALPAPWRAVRGLVVGAVVLSLSVIAVTFGHLDIFDFDRLQAWAWVTLFIAFALLTMGILWFGEEEEPDGEAPPLARGARALLGVVAVLLGALAIALWADPTGLAEPSPFDLPPLGGRFAGCWIALVAVLCGWAAARNRTDEAWLPALGLAALPTGALIAGLRTIDHLDPAGATAAYLAGLALLAACGATVLVSLRRTPTRERAARA